MTDKIVTIILSKGEDDMVTVAGIKTKEQRLAEVRSLVKAVANRELTASKDIPAEVVAIADSLDGLTIGEVLDFGSGLGNIDKTMINGFKTDKGSTLFSLFYVHKLKNYAVYKGYKMLAKVSLSIVKDDEK